VLLHRVHAGLDDGGLVAHQIDRVAGREVTADLGDLRLHELGHLHGVRPGLLAKREEHGGRTVEQAADFLLLLGVDHLADVPDERRVTGRLPHHQVADLGGIGDPTVDAQGELPGPLSTRPPGVVRFCERSRAARRRR